MASVARGAPDAVYAITALAETQPGAGARVAWLTLQRAGVIGAGLWVAGIRNEQLLRGALSGAAAGTVWIYLGARRG